jgi:hypothetical protein
MRQCSILNDGVFDIALQAALTQPSKAKPAGCQARPVRLFVGGRNEGGGFGVGSSPIHVGILASPSRSLQSYVPFVSIGLADDLPFIDHKAG